MNILAKENMLKGLCVLTWLLYALVIAYLDWSKSNTYSMLMGVYGIVGAVIAILIFRTRKANIIFLCLSVVLMVLYLGKWGQQITDRHSGDATAGLFREILLQGQMWAAMLSSRISNHDYLAALAEGYWLFGMTVIQLVLFLMILSKTKSAKVRSKERIV